MFGGIWTTATTTTIASPRGSRHLPSWRMLSSMARPGFWRECPCRRSRPGLASWSWRFAPGQVQEGLECASRARAHRHGGWQSCLNTAERLRCTCAVSQHSMDHTALDWHGKSKREQNSKVLSIQHTACAESDEPLPLSTRGMPAKSVTLPHKL